MVWMPCPECGSIDITYKELHKMFTLRPYRIARCDWCDHKWIEADYHENGCKKV